MQILTIKLNGKTYQAGKITVFISKEALKIQKEALELAKKGNEIQKNTGDIEQIDKVQELLNGLSELRDRKSWLICEVYQNKFTVDELEKELTNEEIEIEINKIINGTNGIILKN